MTTKSLVAWAGGVLMLIAGVTVNAVPSLRGTESYPGYFIQLSLVWFLSAIYMKEMRR